MLATASRAPPPGGCLHHTPEPHTLPDVEQVYPTLVRWLMVDGTIVLGRVSMLAAASRGIPDANGDISWIVPLLGFLYFADDPDGPVAINEYLDGDAVHQEGGPETAWVHGLARTTAGEQPARCMVRRGVRVRPAACEREQYLGEQSRHRHGRSLCAAITDAATVAQLPCQ